MTAWQRAGTQPVRGSALHCSGFGCVVRLADGRLAVLPAEDPGFEVVRKLLQTVRRPELDFFVVQDAGRRVRVALARAAKETAPALEALGAGSSAAFERKITDFLRQTAEWDSRGAASDWRRPKRPTRAERSVRFEKRLHAKARSRE